MPLLLKIVLVPFIVLFVTLKVIYLSLRHWQSPFAAMAQLKADAEKKRPLPSPFQKEFMEAGEEIRQMLYLQTERIEGEPVVFKQIRPQRVMGDGVELCALFSTAPRLDESVIKTALAKVGAVAMTDNDWVVTVPTAVTEASDGTRRPLTVTVHRALAPVDPTQWVSEEGVALEDPQLRSRLGAMKYQWTARENNPGIGAQFRLTALSEVMRAMVSVAPAQLIGCPRTQLLSSTRQLMDASLPSSVMAVVKIQSVRVANGESGSMLTDTRGLSCVGLPELQFHVKDVAARDVTELLLELTVQLVEHGANIEMGATVEFENDALPIFRASYEESLRQPNLVVIDFDGGEFAAGIRSMRQAVN